MKPTLVSAPLPGAESAGVERDHFDIADPGGQCLHVVDGVLGLGKDRLLLNGRTATLLRA